MNISGDKQYGPDTTCEEVLQPINLDGKRCVVTGASGGLGLQTAKALASKGAHVTLAVRSIEKGHAAAEAIREETADARLDVQSLDLSDLSSVRKFAERYRSDNGRLDILVCNAAVMATPFAKTHDGFEQQFGVNHLGHFVLIGNLVETLLASAPSRVVLVSSAGHRFGPMDFDDPNYQRREYEKWAAYGQSKTANVLCAVELDRRLRSRGVTVNAVHPGAIMTDLSRHLTRAEVDGLKELVPGGIHWKTVSAGAATAVWAATAPELDGNGGNYLEDCHIAEVLENPPTLIGCAPHALDPDNAQRLWQLSERLVQQQFVF